ncbi:hypothetical protein PC9H_003732 [Pleurotus ostreatus]|uniref:Pre-rRNA-processing protein n=1 Tax=Pleurotus ostreatus TaxID=5322 RepID=A0A8H7DWR0_PLEOS|nr:uncharacterized protein PC9H_003732 [Pleurotus ostreatus]KAF7436898.1 hypothetical protein PC9H_003732 [Pleurotus ostreatus]KAJ8702696.1 rRNA processing protein [Pleurotus ostreatus]
MPKSAKKRKEKAADFSKAKLKLGKGKQTPSNVIDTSFKARSIALPNQSISREKDVNVPTTRKNLSIGDLVTHLKHYNPGIRRDALSSMRELLDAHWEVLESSLPPLLNACVRLIADEDASVRKSLYQFLSWLLPRIPQENLIAHASVLLLFTTSAQTHIFPEIRLDAVRIVDLLLENIPEIVVQGWDEGKAGHGARILEGYLGALNAGTAFNENHGKIQATSTASVILTPSSKLILLQSLSSFLLHALSSGASTSHDDPYTAPFDSWYIRPSFISQDAHTSFDDLLRPTHSQPSKAKKRRWRAEANHGDGDIFVSYCPFADILSPDISIQTLSESVSSAVVDETDVKAPLVMHIARALRGTLISTFLDFAPSAFSPNGKASETDMKLVLAVANIARSLYSSIAQRDTTSMPKDAQAARDDLKTLINYMSSYFPFSSSGSRDIKIDEALLEMNLVYCQLTSLLVLTSKTPQPSARGKQGHPDNASAVHAEAVSEYVISLLNGEPVNGTQLGRALTPDAYVALLPTIWSFVSSTAGPNDSFSAGILAAVLSHATRASSKSAIKKLTIEFVGRLALLDTERSYTGSFRLARFAGQRGALEEWINHLPKVLWELGATSLVTSEIIIRCLIRLIQRRSGIIHDSTISTLRSRLAPYFCVEHPTRGRIMGPFKKLPIESGLQNLSLDLVAILQVYNGAAPSDGALEEAVDLAVAGTDMQSYWCSVRQ